MILKSENDDQLRHYAKRLHNKPLLLKWSALGVVSGLSPWKIVSNPETALRFCRENVFDALSTQTKNHLSALVSLPRAVSLAILKYVTQNNAKDLEASLAELQRFAIIEQVTAEKYEVEFQIKPLPKPYSISVLKATSKNSDEILSRFRQIEGIYQNERGASKHDRYNPNHFVVRSKTKH